MRTFDEIMQKLLVERSSDDEVEEQQPSGPFLAWDEDYWKWLVNKRYDICLIGEQYAITEMGNTDWNSQKASMANSINKHFYVIAPVGAAALLAEASGLWTRSLKSIMSRKHESMMNVAPYILCIPPDAIRWYPKIEEDLAGIGMKCVFDARKHKDVYWIWTADASKMEKRFCQPDNDKVYGVMANNKSICIPNMQHRQGFTIWQDDIIEDKDEIRCPNCGTTGNMAVLKRKQLDKNWESHLFCRECEWMGHWIVEKAYDEAVIEAIFDETLEVFEWYPPETNA